MFKPLAVLLLGILFSTNSFAAQDNNPAKINLRAVVLEAWNEQDAELYNVLFTGEHKGVFDLSAITYVQYEKMKYWQVQAPVLFTEMFAAAWPESMRSDYVPRKSRPVSPQDETLSNRLANNTGRRE